MMGYSHTVSAAAGWLILAETGVVQVPDTPTLIVTTLACAGAGMLPDIDHHNGSIANSIPPLSRWLARVVGAISGGHRKGTHSLIGLIAFWAIAYFSIQLTYQGVPWVSLILAGFSGGLALRVLGAPGGWIGAIILGYAASSTGSLSLLPGPPEEFCRYTPSSSNLRLLRHFGRKVATWPYRFWVMLAAPAKKDWCCY